MRQKYIIFDLGNVIVDWSPRRLYQKIIQDPARLDHFLKVVVSSEWNSQTDLGIPFQQLIDDRIKIYPEFKEELSVYRSRWREMLAGEIPGTSKILRTLCDQDVPVYAITNFAMETFPIAQSIYPCLEWFHDIVISAEHGVKKPDPKIFEIFMQRNSVRAQDGLFIDDLSENIEAAKGLGFDGIVFQNAEQLKMELQARGWRV